MATKKASARTNSIPAPDELPQEPAAVLREELRLIRDEIVDEGRRVAFGAALLGGAGVLGLGAFGALTTAAIAALARQDTTRGALLVAAVYGAGAGALAEVGADGWVGSRRKRSRTFSKTSRRRPRPCGAPPSLVAALPLRGTSNSASDPSAGFSDSRKSGTQSTSAGLPVAGESGTSRGATRRPRRAFVSHVEAGSPA
jgi:hypothetical protein